MSIGKEAQLTQLAARRSVAIAILLFILDIASKWAAATLWSGKTSGLVTPALNHNLALGSVSLEQGITPTVAIVLLLAATFFIASIAATLSGRIHPLGLALLLSGTLANGVDRLVTGAVHDWMNLGVVVANIADFVLLAGLAMLLRSFWQGAADL